jgi:1-acyl-sn-glycerol-3-phosphate acyltransferase
MNFFYYLLSAYFFFSSFYYFHNNFKSIDDFITNIFKNILIFFEYKVEEIDLEKLPSKIIFIGSHTSIYDFIIGTLFYYGYLHKKYDTYVLMKKEFQVMCNPIIRFFDKKFKLISIDTSNKKVGVTKQICDDLADKDNYILFISPEGTRKCTEKIRTGYWYISKKLDTHIVFVGIDFLNKSIVLEKERKPKDTWEEEEEEFIKCCKKYTPLYPDLCFWTKDFYAEK